MSIREKASLLLNETGLHRALEQFGAVYITGSYAMDMMTWNDLDVYLLPDPARFDMYELISSVNSALHPFRLDGIVKPDENRYFYGAEFLFLEERWNVDIWVKTQEEIRKSEAYCQEIVRQTAENPTLRKAIIDIKEALIERGMYGMDKHPQLHYHSGDIYSAVLTKNITTAEAFLSAGKLPEE